MQAEDAHRLAHVFAVDAAGDFLQRLAHQERRRSARDLDHLDAAPDAAARFAQRLAVLARDGRDQLLGVFFQERLQAEEVLDAVLGRQPAPGRERFLRGARGGVDIRRARQRALGDGLAGGGVADDVEFLGVGGDPLAADVVLQTFDGHA